MKFLNYTDISKEISTLYNRDAMISDFLAFASKIERSKIERPDYIRPFKIALLSNFTLQGLPEVMRSLAWFYHLDLAIYLGPYDQYAQEILNEDSGFNRFNPDVVFLCLDAPGVEFDDISSLIERLRQRVKRVVLWNFAGNQDAERLNQRCADVFASQREIYIFDFKKFLSDDRVRESWYSKYKDLGDYRLAPSAFRLLAEALIGEIISDTGVLRKCLVLDADNTLWKGIVGEDGVGGIAPFIPVQEVALSLYKKGILLALNSKNNERDATEVFESHSEMLLGRNHFSAWQVNWNDKLSNLMLIAKELNIGTDSLVFVDDNPSELEYVRCHAPEVTVLFPERLKDFVGFNSRSLTDEDRARSLMYQVEKERKVFQHTTSNLTEYLKGLALSVRVSSVNEKSIARVSQLTQKTNQFNLTTRRYTEDELRRQLRRGWKILTLSSLDKFGDYGITGVCIIAPVTDAVWRIDTMLLSCRILGKGIEQAFLWSIFDYAKKNGIKNIRAEFIKTAKNAPSEHFLPDNGFQAIANIGDTLQYEYNLKVPYDKPSFVHVTLDL